MLVVRSARIRVVNLVVVVVVVEVEEGGDILRIEKTAVVIGKGVEVVEE